MRRCVLLVGLFLSASPAIAQEFTAGIKVGGQLTDALGDGSPPTHFDHFTFGPVVEASIAHKFSVEFDALHAHYAYNYFFLGQLHETVGMVDTHISYWDFPLLLKWWPAGHRLAPFVAGGIANRYTIGTGLAPTLFPTPQGLVPVAPSPSPLLHRWTTGLAVAGGVSYGVGPFHFSPELRYTFWTKAAIEQPTLTATGTATAWEQSRNQFEILLGLTVGRR